MGINMLSFNNKRNITKFLLIQKSNKILLLNLIKVYAEIASRICRCFKLLLDWTQPTRFIDSLILILMHRHTFIVAKLIVFLDLLIDIGVVGVWGILALSTSFLVRLTWFSVDVFLVVSGAILFVLFYLKLIVWWRRKLAWTTSELGVLKRGANEVDDDGFFDGFLIQVCIHDESSSVG